MAADTSGDERVRRGYTRGRSLQQSSLPPTLEGLFPALRHHGTANAHPFKGTKFGNNLLFPFIKREIKSFRHMPPALEDSVAKWTIFNYTPVQPGNRSLRTERQHPSGSWQRQGPLTTLLDGPADTHAAGTTVAVGLWTGSSCCLKTLRHNSCQIACHMGLLIY